MIAAHVSPHRPNREVTQMARVQCHAKASSFIQDSECRGGAGHSRKFSGNASCDWKGMGRKLRVQTATAMTTDCN